MEVSYAEKLECGSPKILGDHFQMRKCMMAGGHFNSLQAHFEAQQTSLNHVFGKGSRMDRLLRFYHRYNPKKVKDISRFLEAYSRESDARLFGDLACKYVKQIQRDLDSSFGKNLDKDAVESSDESEEDGDAEDDNDSQLLPACQVIGNALAIGVKVPPCRNLEEAFEAAALSDEVLLRKSRTDLPKRR